jgi:hypothetical protein
MKKILNIRTLPVYLLVIILVILYAPSFKLNFSLLDDGLSLLNASYLKESVLNLNLMGIVDVVLEPEHGRVRPGYWLIQSLFVYLSMGNSFIMHFLRFLLLLITLFLTSKLLYKFEVDYASILFALFIFSFNIQNFENYYRLGPVEPYLILVLCLIYYLIFVKETWKKTDYILIAFISLLGGLIKENFFLTGLVLVPVFIINAIQKNKKENKKIAFSALAVILSGVIVFALKNTYPPGGVYASNYVVSLEKIAVNTISYLKLISFYQSPLFILAIFHLTYFIYRLTKNKISHISQKEKFYMVLWLQVLIQIVVLSPWNYVLNRYLSFLNINLALLYAFVTVDILTLIHKSKSVFLKNSYLVFGVILLALAAQPFTRSFFNIANQQLFAQVDSEISYKSVKALADNIPSGETVYVNYKKGDNNIEIYEETKWHLDLLHNRPDINFEYIDDSNLCTKANRYIFDRRSDRFLDSLSLVNKSNINIIANGEVVYEPINYGQVLKSFKDRHRYEAWEDEHIFDWRILIQKGGTCLSK